jgi:hypothetical protein
MRHACQFGLMMVLLLGMGAPAAPAQSTADAYFHEAAQQYVADDVQAARQTVERGLEVAPSDPRLLALRKKLRQEKQPNRPRKQRDSSSAESGQKKKQDQSSGKSGNADSESSEQNSPSQSEAQNAPPKEEGSGSSEGRSADRPPSPDTVRRGRGGQPSEALNRTQAERLLRALEGQERRLLRQIRIRSSKRRTVEKDW